MALWRSEFDGALVAVAAGVAEFCWGIPPVRVDTIIVVCMQEKVSVYIYIVQLEVQARGSYRVC